MNNKLQWKDHNFVLDIGASKINEGYDISWAMNKYVNLLDQSSGIHSQIYFSNKAFNTDEVEKLQKQLSKVEEEIKQMEFLYPTLAVDYNRGNY